MVALTSPNIKTIAARHRLLQLLVGRLLRSSACLALLLPVSRGWISTRRGSDRKARDRGNTPCISRSRNAPSGPAPRGKATAMGLGAVVLGRTFFRSRLPMELQSLLRRDTVTQVQVD